jgi:S-adenosylmethionine hydrolase
MSIITFTTDWGTRDFHIGALKGMLLSRLSNLQMIDISHQIARHNIQQAAYIFKNAHTHFPAGTLHLVGVYGQSKYEPQLIALKKNGHIFIGVNDGFFSLVFDEMPIDVVTIGNRSAKGDLFDLPVIVETATALLNGTNLYELGERPDHIVQRSSFQPTIDEELIHGIVIYIDDYGNIVTNISRELFEGRRKGRSFEIVARKSQYSINKISHFYNSVEPGSALALFNDAGLLEIAINEDSALKLMNIKLNDNIRIEFK